MIIQLNEMLEIPGKTSSFEVPFEGDHILTYPVKQRSMTGLTVHHKKDRQIDITGHLTLSVEMPCDRCLSMVEVTVDQDIERSVDLTEGRDEDGEPCEFALKDAIDTQLLFEETVLENLPMKVLCREDCKGLCPVCGADLNKGPCGCETVKAPTRMQEALMKALQNKDKK